MRDPKPASPIALTTEEVKQIQHLIRAHTTPQTLVVRARIILNAHEQTNQQIASAVGTTDHTVRTWRPLGQDTFAP
jgi:predicted transcriptional regulator